MFGEPIPMNVLRRCFQEAEKSDLMLIIGTSALVQPAASLPLMVRDNGGLLIEVNPMETQISQICEVCIRAPSGFALPLLVNEVKKKKKSTEP
jgi:NAD-dependent deacetylase